MIQTLAHLHFSDGKEMPFPAGTIDAARQTASAFKDKGVTLFETTFMIGQLMARIDILDRDGRDIRVMEAKAKSIDTSKPLAEVFTSRNGIRPNGIHTWKMLRSKRSSFDGSIPISHSPHSSVSPTKARPPEAPIGARTRDYRRRDPFCWRPPRLNLQACWFKRH